MLKYSEEYSFITFSHNDGHGIAWNVKKWSEILLLWAFAFQL